MAQRRPITCPSQFANLAAMGKSFKDIRDPLGYCPLMLSTVELIPVRYGLVEALDPGAQGVQMPYRLTAHPLGFRVLRDGFLYVIDGRNDALQAYRIQDSMLLQLDNGDDAHLTFRRGTHLHIAYSQVQWTRNKCAQMISQPEEREYFMQKVELPEVGAQNGRHLFDGDEMRQWLGEVTLSRDPSQMGRLIAESNEMSANGQRPWDWEHAPLFYHTLIEELSSKAGALHHKDYLFVAVPDDIGVMRDLAHYQDQVIGKLDDWRLSGTEEGQVERDYVLGCYIESLTQVSSADLARHAGQNPAFQAMLDELDQMPEPQRSQTRDDLQAALGEDASQHPLPSPADPELPADLKSQLAEIRSNTTLNNTHGQFDRITETMRLYYLKQRFTHADQAFLDRHQDALWRAYKEQSGVTEQVLYGAKFGSRGINELIDRPGMDAFLLEQRAQLSTLNDQLDRITADRVQLLTENRFQRAAWYYDITDAQQVEQALAIEYACLKDICRSDDGNEKIRAWLEENLIFTRPMLYALPRSIQTELGTQLTSFGNASWLLMKDSAAWVANFGHWGKGVVLNVEHLPQAQQITAHAIWKTLEPAIQQGIAEATQDFINRQEQGRLPDMEALLRRMPKAAGLWILDAARRERVTFRVAGIDDIRALDGVVSDVLHLRRQLRVVNNALHHGPSLGPGWHLHSDAAGRRAYRRDLQNELTRLESHLADAMSPLAELPPRTLPLQTATSLKPGLSLVFPAEQHAQVKSLLENYRKGVHSVPAAGLLGDGAGVLVFVAQLVNFLQVVRETLFSPGQKTDLASFRNSVLATVSAGFGAAQGIFDSALQAHAKELAGALLNAELRGVNVQMGKLHIGLGLPGYVAGLAAAGFNLNNSLNNWSNAVRSGNRQAQAGALVSATGNAGFVGSNAYGLYETGVAFKQVMLTTAGSAERLVAWASAGSRLSTVFMRFNIAGIIFTALELVGTWLYNRYNISQHDRWLLATPWSLEPGTLPFSSLSTYQRRLRAVIEAPVVEIRSVTSHLRGEPDTRQCLLHFPTLTAQHLAAPLATGRADIMLRVGGYRIQRKFRQYTKEVWTPLTPEELTSRLLIHHTNPLTVCLNNLQSLSGVSGPDHYDLMVMLQILHSRPDGLHSVTEHNLRFRLARQTGEVLKSDDEPQGEPCELVAIQPIYLPEALTLHD